MYFVGSGGEACIAYTVISIYFLGTLSFSIKSSWDEICQHNNAHKCYTAYACKAHTTLYSTLCISVGAAWSQLSCFQLFFFSSYMNEKYKQSRKLILFALHAIEAIKLGITYAARQNMRIMPYQFTISKLKC